MNILKDSAILSLQDLYRIKNSSYIPSNTTANTNKLSRSSLSQDIKHEIYLNKILEHKNRILEYDKKKKEYNDYIAMEKNKIFQKYPGVSDDDEAVRAMDKMCLYARISTVRDKQLEEKKEIEKMLKKKEEKIDLMVEIERLKELKLQEEKEKNLEKMKKDGKKVILEQIEENKKIQIKQKELEEKER